MTGRKARGKLLNEFIEVTGWERKHANKVLLGIKRKQGKARQGKARQGKARQTGFSEALRSEYLRSSENLLVGHETALRQTHERHAPALDGAPGVRRQNENPARPDQCRKYRPDTQRFHST